MRSILWPCARICVCVHCSSVLCVRSTHLFALPRNKYLYLSLCVRVCEWMCIYIYKWIESISVHLYSNAVECLVVTVTTQNLNVKLNFLMEIRHSFTLCAHHTSQQQQQQQKHQTSNFSLSLCLALSFAMDWITLCVCAVSLFGDGGFSILSVCT